MLDLFLKVRYTFLNSLLNEYTHSKFTNTSFHSKITMIEFWSLALRVVRMAIAQPSQTMDR